MLLFSFYASLICFYFTPLLFVVLLSKMAVKMNTITIHYMNGACEYSQKVNQKSYPLNA